MKMDYERETSQRLQSSYRKMAMKTVLLLPKENQAINIYDLSEEYITYDRNKCI